MKSHKITWEQYDKDIHALAQMIKLDGFQTHCITAIPRGGLIIGVHLSHLLEVPLTDNPFGNHIVVDDVSDTGNTLLTMAREKMRRRRFATLYKKTGSKVTPDFWVAEFDRDTWIVYPWEV